MNKNTSLHIVHRAHLMAMWVYDQLAGWVRQHDIDDLTVLIETPIMRSEVRGVVTMATQMRMVTAYEEVLYQLQAELGDSVIIRLGEVHNQTAKHVFTGTAKADKTIMIVHSAWAKRPDVREREHLADSQAIGMCNPELLAMDESALVPMVSLYEDHAIGQGPSWKGKL